MRAKPRNENSRPSLLFRLHRARLIIIALVLIGVGLGLMYLDAGKIVDSIGETLFTMGGLSILGDFAARNIADARIFERVKEILASIFYGPYRALVDRMNRAPYQRHEARVVVTLTDAGHDDMFVALVRCEHRTNAPLGERTFLCANNRYSPDYYASRNVLDYWIANPSRGLNVTNPKTFTLLDYSINGQQQTITDAVTSDEHVFTVKPRGLHIQRGELYHESYTYTALVPQGAQWLRFTIDVPTRGYTVEVHHFDSNINRLSLAPFFASETEPRLANSNPVLPAPASVSVDGWIMPTSGVAIAWTLNLAP